MTKSNESRTKLLSVINSNELMKQGELVDASSFNTPSQTKTTSTNAVESSNQGANISSTSSMTNTSGSTKGTSVPKEFINLTNQLDKLLELGERLNSDERESGAGNREDQEEKEMRRELLRIQMRKEKAQALYWEKKATMEEFDHDEELL